MAEGLARVAGAETEGGRRALRSSNEAERFGDKNSRGVETVEASSLALRSGCERNRTERCSRGRHAAGKGWRRSSERQCFSNVCRRLQGRGKLLVPVSEGSGLRIAEFVTWCGQGRDLSFSAAGDQWTRLIHSKRAKGTRGCDVTRLWRNTSDAENHEGCFFDSSKDKFKVGALNQ